MEEHREKEVCIAVFHEMSVDPSSGTVTPSSSSSPLLLS